MSEEMTEQRSIETITAEILVYKAQAGAAILEIGKRLIEAKEQLSHGEWLPWLEHQVDFTERQAQRFMRLAQHWENPTTLSDLGASKALALLEIPVEERETFAAEVDAEHCSVRELRAAIRAREEAVNQAKGWQLKCEQAKADADAAREAAKKREEELSVSQGVIRGLKEEKKQLKAEVKDLKSRPVEVATKDASPEQIAQARQQGRAEAQPEIDRLTQALEEAKRRQAETRPVADQTIKTMAEINALFGQIQQASGRIRALLPQLDEITRARVAGVLKQTLQEVG